MPTGWVYMMTNRPYGTLYIGVATNLARRAWEHREGDGDGFAALYGLTQLVLAERHDTIAAAIQRETSLKRWKRAWKVALIETANPNWDDLFPLPARGI